VTIDDKTVARIDTGILLLLGIEKDDDRLKMEKMARKIFSYRIFSDVDGKMNKSLSDINGELLVVSQFTLVANTAKGNRPGFSKGASPTHGEHIYQSFIEHVGDHYRECQAGVFGADMAVSLINDGPVTFWIET
jgi:D-tyrosyl-tRNA(Tyr) deacylase